MERSSGWLWGWEAKRHFDAMGLRWILEGVILDGMIPSCRDGDSGVCFDDDVLEVQGDSLQETGKDLKVRG